MRVVGVELLDHPGVGNLVVDFRMPDHTAPRWVVIAGSNGSGKTAVLETIYAALIPTNLLLNSPNLRSSGRARVLVEIDGPGAETVLPDPIAPELFGHMREHWPDFNGYVVELDWENGGRYPGQRHITNLRHNTRIANASELPLLTQKPLSCFYSGAQLGFEVEPIRSVTAISNPAQVGLAAAVEFPLRGDATLAKQIPQLFVDLENADGTDALRWLRQNEVGRPLPEMIGGRIRRFTQAFERLIPHKRFQGIQTAGGELTPLFSDGLRQTPISKLSTGEKQIIFRGTFLLRQFEHLSGAVVMIDEPELSLHPTWQSGILDYYDRIVWEGHEETSQIILATHSPFVIHGSPGAKHVVLRRDAQTGEVSVDPTPSFVGVTPGEIAIAAFNLSEISFGRPQAPLGLITEGRTDAQILAMAWDILRGGPRPFALIPAGGATSIVNLVGEDPAKPGWLWDTVRPFGIDRFLCLYDFDDRGFGQWNGLIPQGRAAHEARDELRCVHRRRQDGRVWAALLPVPNYRQDYASLELFPIR